MNLKDDTHHTQQSNPGIIYDIKKTTPQETGDLFIKKTPMIFITPV